MNRDQAVRALREIAERHQLHASPSHATQAPFSVDFASRDERVLTVAIEPLRDEGNYYRRREHLGLWYQTADDCEPTSALLAEVASWFDAVSETTLAASLHSSSEAAAEFPRYSVFDLVRKGLKPAASLLVDAAHTRDESDDVLAYALSDFAFRRDRHGNLVYVAPEDCAATAEENPLQRMLYAGTCSDGARRAHDIEKQIYAGSWRTPRKKQKLQEELGIALGFPHCCARAFATGAHSRRRQGEFYGSIEALGWHLQPIDWRLNHIAARQYSLPFLIHVPCSATCHATASHVDAAMSALYRPSQREVVREVLEQGAVVFADDRVLFFSCTGVDDDRGELSIANFNQDAHPEVLGTPRDPSRCVAGASRETDAAVTKIRRGRTGLEVTAGASWHAYATAAEQSPPPLILAPRTHSSSEAKQSAIGASGPLPASFQTLLIPLLRPLYRRYLQRLLSHYLPSDSRAPATALDAMCGRNFPNLTALRQILPTTASLHATDIDIDPRRPPPAGIEVFAADLRTALPEHHRYDLITVFKPPIGPLGDDTASVFQHLIERLTARGVLFVVLGELDQGQYIGALAERNGLRVVVSEPNSLGSFLEPQHRWVLVARS